MRNEKHTEKKNDITDKLEIESDVEINRCHIIGPRKNRPR